MITGEWALKYNFTSLFGIAFIAGCQPPSPTEAEETPTPQVELTASLSAGSPQVITAAKAAILQEPGVIDLVHQPNETFQWIVGMKSDGSYRFGFAESLCLLLKEKGVDVSRQAVRIVDYQKFIRDGDGRAASMGAVDCQSGQHSFP